MESSIPERSFVKKVCSRYLPRSPFPIRAFPRLPSVQFNSFPTFCYLNTWTEARNRRLLNKLLKEATYILTYILYLSCRSVKKEAAKELMWTYKLKRITRHPQPIIHWWGSFLKVHFYLVYHFINAVFFLLFYGSNAYTVDCNILLWVAVTL